MPENIFIDLSQDPVFRNCEEEEHYIKLLKDFNSKSKFTVKIGDFGVSKSTESINKETIQRGNLLFKALELTDDDRVHEKADTWSVGVMILHLL